MASGLKTKSFVAKIAFLVDVTASMSPSIHAVHSTIENLLQQATQAFPGIKLQVAFVGYRDVDQPTPVVQPFVGIEHIDQFLATVRNTSATGGGDFPEDVLGGMETALKSLDWSNSKIKILFHCADAPHHGPKFCGSSINDSHPELENLPRPSSEILGDYADSKIDYYLMQIEVNGKNYIERMSSVFQSEYNACASKTKDMTIFQLNQHFNVEDFFTQIMAGVSQSVQSFLQFSPHIQNMRNPEPSAPPLPSSAIIFAYQPAPYPPHHHPPPPPHFRQENSDESSIAGILRDIRTPPPLPPPQPIPRPPPPSPRPSIISRIFSIFSSKTNTNKQPPPIDEPLADWLGMVLLNNLPFLDRATPSNLQRVQLVQAAFHHEKLFTCQDLRICRDSKILTAEFVRTILHPHGVSARDISMIHNAITAL